MEPIRLSDVLRATGGEPAHPIAGDPWIPSVSTDSRRVEGGALFVPLRGLRFDGHVFVEQAFLNGAGFALVSQDSGFARVPPRAIVVADTRRALGDLARWHRSRFDVPVVGITGSCGKTTVKEMVRLVLGDEVVASPASYNNDVGVPLTLLQMTRRTRACVVEIGTNAPGEIAHLTKMARPTVGVLTNVEESHLAGLGSVRGVMAEKAALLDLLPDTGAAVVNADNYWCREIMERIQHTHLISFGTWEDATIYGLESEPTPEGCRFRLFGKMPIQVPALGMHNVSNALAAIAVGLWLGREPLAIAEALRRFRSPAMRMERAAVGSVTLINDAYNANPASMDAAIRELLLRPCSGRRVAVLGEMLELGGEAERCHRSLGRKAANEGVDRLWAIGAYGDIVAAEAIGRGMPPEHVAWSPSVKDALEAPAFQPEPGDAWLFKASRRLELERLLVQVQLKARALHPLEDSVGARRLDASGA